MRIQGAFCIAAFLFLNFCFFKYFISIYLSVWAMYLSSCNYSEIRDERNFSLACELPLAGRVRTLCIARLQCLPYERENEFCLEYIGRRNVT